MGLDGGAQQPVTLGSTRYIPENAGMPQPKQLQMGLKYKPPFGQSLFHSHQRIIDIFDSSEYYRRDMPIYAQKGFSLDAVFKEHLKKVSWLHCLCLQMSLAYSNDATRSLPFWTSICTTHSKTILRPQKSIIVYMTKFKKSPNLLRSFTT